MKMRKLRYLLEAAIVLCFFGLFRLMSIDRASCVAGYIARLVGPYVRVSNVARRNIEACYPDLLPLEVETLLGEMWENLGRIIGEMPHIRCLSPSEFQRRIKIVGEVVPTPHSSQLFISAHLGNFEIPAKLSVEAGLGLNLVYRPANNPYVDGLVKYLRNLEGKPLIPKGQAGLRQIVHLIEQHQNIGMLVDQKMNNGIIVKFFGQDAKTTSLPAKLALKYKLPIYLTFMVRIRGANFEVHFQKLTVDFSCDTELSITQRINDELESWIRKYPSQWFWVHKRW